MNLPHGLLLQVQGGGLALGKLPVGQEHHVVSLADSGNIAGTVHSVHQVINLEG